MKFLLLSNDDKEISNYKKRLNQQGHVILRIYKNANEILEKNDAECIVFGSIETMGSSVLETETNKRRLTDLGYRLFFNESEVNNLQGNLSFGMFSIMEQYYIARSKQKNNVFETNEDFFN